MLAFHPLHSGYKEDFLVLGCMVTNYSREWNILLSYFARWLGCEGKSDSKSQGAEIELSVFRPLSINQRGNRTTMYELPYESIFSSVFMILVLG